MYVSVVVSLLLVTAQTCFGQENLDGATTSRDSGNQPMENSKESTVSEKADLNAIDRDHMVSARGLPTNGDACYTPEGRPGTCVDIRSCAPLIDLLRQPATPWETTYIRNSICDMNKYTVCCGPPPESPSKRRRSGRTKCETLVSAFPPNPLDGCCGVDSRLDSRIIGGTATAIDEHPWMALIEYQSTRNTSIIECGCGGVLISGKYVLSAAHCFRGNMVVKRKPIRVRLGEHDLMRNPDCVPEGDGGGEDCADHIVQVPIQEIIIHPEFGPGMKNDIAVLRLTGMAPFTDFIRPICLPTIDITKLPTNKTGMLFVAGWGKIDYVRSSNVKKHVDVPYVPLDICQLSYKKNPLWDKQICAGGAKDKDSCGGDSGGPLMYENERSCEVVGIVSFGAFLCGTKGMPGVYTDVFKYNTWIRKQIRP